MWFRAYFLAAKLAILGGILLGIALVAQDFGYAGAAAACSAAALACFVPYFGLAVVLRLRKPELACPLCGVSVAWNESVLHHQLNCPNCGRVSGRPTRDWQLHADPAERTPYAATPDGWRPDAICVFISEALVPQMRKRQEDVFRQIRALRRRYGIETRVHIVDDTLLAGRSYGVNINGVRAAGYSLASHDDFPSHLLAALESAFHQYGDAIRFFGAQQPAEAALSGAD